VERREVFVEEAEGEEEDEAVAEDQEEADRDAVVTAAALVADEEAEGDNISTSVSVTLHTKRLVDFIPTLTKQLNGFDECALYQYQSALSIVLFNSFFFYSSHSNT